VSAEIVASWLAEHMISFEHMATILSNVIPSVLTIPAAFNSRSENQVAATLTDVADRLGTLKPSTGELGSNAVGLRRRFSGVVARRAAVSQSLAGITVDAAEGSSFRRRRLSTGRRMSLGSSIISLDSGLSTIALEQNARLTWRRTIWASMLINAMSRGVLARNRLWDLRRQRDAGLIILAYFRRHRRLKTRNTQEPLSADEQRVYTLGRSESGQRMVLTSSTLGPSDEKIAQTRPSRVHSAEDAKEFALDSISSSLATRRLGGARKMVRSKTAGFADDLKELEGEMVDKYPEQQRKTFSGTSADEPKDEWV